jgi:hypothetical protein
LTCAEVGTTLILASLSRMYEGVKPVFPLAWMSFTWVIIEIIKKDVSPHYYSARTRLA